MRQGSEKQYMNKLEQRLKLLTDSPSQESIQTLCNWLIFNRPYASYLLSTILDSIISLKSSAVSSSSSSSNNNNNNNNNIKRQSLYLKILHDLLMYHYSPENENEKKFERGTVYRRLFKDDEEYTQKLLDSIRLIKCNEEEDSEESDTITGKLKDMIEEWEDCIDLFHHNPGIYVRLRKILDDEEINIIPEERKNEKAKEISKKDEDIEMSDVKEENETKSNNMEAMVIEKVEEKEQETNKLIEKSTSESNTENIPVQPLLEPVEVKMSEKEQAPLVTQPSSEEKKIEVITSPPVSMTPKVELEPIDFDNIKTPFEKLHPQNLYDSCKSITMLQIPREIQMDSATRYHQLLQTIPSQIEEFAKTLQSASTPLDIENQKEVDLSILSDDLLDIPMEEALREIKTLQQSIQKQYQARKLVFDSLHKCHYKFGALDAAQEFEATKKKVVALKKIKIDLEDAMELEGVDIEEIVQMDDNGSAKYEHDAEKALEKLGSLDWYDPNQPLLSVDSKG